ncbi:hypothetical protein HDU76_007265 [Blyttiomyces sp. JEL0837]|nr:hypothetical protein HDU76_007265 [Blyttiomyces sp. JEL0837]
MGHLFNIGVRGTTGNIPDVIAGNQQVQRQLPRKFCQFAATAIFPNIEKKMKRIDINSTSVVIPPIRYADNNQLSGDLPDFFGNLQNLQILNIHDNKFTGSIPQAWGNSQSLKNIYLERNQLIGDIPSGLISRGVQM